MSIAVPPTRAEFDSRALLVSGRPLALVAWVNMLIGAPVTARTGVQRGRAVTKPAHTQVPHWWHGLTALRDLTESCNQQHGSKVTLYMRVTHLLSSLYDQLQSLSNHFKLNNSVFRCKQTFVTVFPKKFGFKKRQQQQQIQKKNNTCQNPQFLLALTY